MIQGRDAKKNTHLACAKVWIKDLLLQIRATGTYYLFKSRLESASNWDALEVVAMLVGQQLLQLGRFSGAQDLLNRWFAHCVGQMPSREAFADYEEREAASDRGADPRPRREARLAPAAASAR